MEIDSPIIKFPRGLFQHYFYISNDIKDIEISVVVSNLMSSLVLISFFLEGEGTV